MVTNNELQNSHSQGLGGSDAHLLASCGKKGIISEPLKKRMEQIKWKLPLPSGLSTDAMKAGHDFENWVQNLYPNAQAEVLYEAELTPYFRTFAHADYVLGEAVLECKFSQKPTAEVERIYEAQCEWYYIMGAKAVHLLIGKGMTIGGKARVVATDLVVIPQNDFLRTDILEGLKLAEEYYKSLPSTPFSQPLTTNVDVDDLLADIAILQRQADQLADKLKEKKEELFQIFTTNNIKEYDADTIKVTIIPETKRESFDSKRFSVENNELYRKYVNFTPVKASIRVKLKD